MHTESILMLIPVIQVGIAAAAIGLSSYLIASRLFARMGRRFSS